MKTPLRLFLTVLVVCLTAGLELYLHAEAPVKLLYAMKQPAWAIPIDGYVAALGLIYLLLGTVIFRSLAGFTFYINKVVFFSAVGLLLAQTGIHAGLLITNSILVSIAGTFLLALAGSFFSFKAWKMDWPSGLVSVVYVLAMLLELVWLWAVFSLNG